MVWSLRQFRGTTLLPEHALHWAWPLALIVTASVELYETWKSLLDEFSRGVLSFAMFGLIVAAIELRGAIEEIASTVVRWIARLFWKAVGRPAANLFRRVFRRGSVAAAAPIKKGGQ
jgi:hypothetical protein